MEEAGASGFSESSNGSGMRQYITPFHQSQLKANWDLRKQSERFILNKPGVQAPPFAGDRGINFTEMNPVFKVLIVEIIERRLLTIETAVDFTTEEEMRCDRAVIGTFAIVFVRAAAKFRIAHYRHLTPQALGFHQFGKRRNIGGDIAQQSSMQGFLAGMGIKFTNRQFDHVSRFTARPESLIKEFSIKSMDRAEGLNKKPTL